MALRADPARVPPPRTLRRALAVWLALSVATALSSQELSSFDLGPEEVGELALEFLEQESERDGEILVTSVLRPDPTPQPTGQESAMVEASVLLDAASRSRPDQVFRVSVIVAGLDESPMVDIEEVAAGDLRGALHWLYRRQVVLPEDYLEVAVFVEELETGRWGLARSEFTDRPAPVDPAGGVVVVEGRSPMAPDPVPHPTETRSRVIRLVPVRQDPAVGRVRLRALVTTDDVRRVEFFVDGELVGEDGGGSFTTSVDLGSRVRPREVEVVAYSHDDLVLGRDELMLNERLSRLRVSITDLRAREGGPGLEIRADVSVPVGSSLDRVEFRLNQELIETLTSPPFIADFPPAPAGNSNFVQVAAFLEDGRSIDDVLLLGEGAIGERIDVTLVEVYSVVTDRSGDPVTDLTAENFTLLRGRRRVPITSFSKAENVPLSLGLVMDTSESMDALMQDAMKAGAQFLAATLQPDDEAFLVDFDTRPRLVQSRTHNVVTLLNRFAQLEAGGFTALYDSIVFAMLEFAPGPGRKALVVLTDGENYRSQFSARRCLQQAKELGVAIYVVDLMALQSLDGRGIIRSEMGDVAAMANSSGGGVHRITKMEELDEAYRKIEAELRSQYILGFAVDEGLTSEELREVEVKVDGRGMKVRSVVGSLAY